MGRTYTEQVGMIQSVVDAANHPEVHSRLTATGLGVDPLVTRLAQNLARVTALNNEQESSRVQWKEKTAELARLLKETDLQASGLLDTMCGTLGKSSIQALNLRKIRSRIRVPRLPQTEQPPTSPAKVA